MSSNESHTVTPPQYIVTTPSEADADEERSEAGQDVAGVPSNTTSMTTVMVEHQQHQQRRVVSQMSRQIASRSFSIASASNSILEEGTLTDGDLQQLHKAQQQSQQQIFTSQKSISTSARSQSLQSSSVTGAPGELAIQIGGGCGNTLATIQLGQQLKAQSSTSIVSSEQRSSFMQKTSSTTSSTSKSKFQSFLQQPEASDHPSSSSSGTFLTAHQKHVRQFVRSTSAHSEAAGGVSMSSRPEKCIRSASTQIDEPITHIGSVDTAGGQNMEHLSVSTSKMGLHQSSSILISKSAETIEMKTSSASSSAGMRTQLTLSGGLLAPPNRKITILSPIHAPPGLHDMLKRAGRSPLSPRISFPGSEADLFG